MPHFIFIQQISVLNILNMLYNLHFFSSKCRLFHNATLFGFCITHILNTGCAKFWKKKSVTKRLIINEFNNILLMVFLYAQSVQIFDTFLIIVNLVFLLARLFYAVSFWKSPISFQAKNNCPALLILITVCYIMAPLRLLWCWMSRFHSSGNWRRVVSYLDVSQEYTSPVFRVISLS